MPHCLSGGVPAAKEGIGESLGGREEVPASGGIRNPNQLQGWVVRHLCLTPHPRLLAPHRVHSVEGRSPGKRRSVSQARALGPWVRPASNSLWILPRACGSTVIPLSPSTRNPPLNATATACPGAGTAWLLLSVTHPSSSRAASPPELGQKAGSARSCLHDEGASVPFSFSSFPQHGQQGPPSHAHVLTGALTHRTSSSVPTGLLESVAVRA